MAGESTQNGYFYKPDYGAYGEAEKALYDAALDATDAVIKTLSDDINSGKIPRFTTTEIQAIADAGTSTDVRIIFNTTRNTIEIWVGFSFAKVL